MNNTLHQKPRPVFRAFLGMGTLALLLLNVHPAPAEEPPNLKWSEDKRFVDNGDMTITDTQTGFMWMKQDSFQQTGHWMSWAQAFEFVEKLNEEGFSNHHDWRVPTREELKTLYEADKFNSAQVGREMNIHIDPIFAKEGGGAMWSNEPNGSFNAFGVIFNTGRVFSSHKNSRSRKAVRAVRYADPEEIKNLTHKRP